MTENRNLNSDLLLVMHTEISQYQGSVFSALPLYIEHFKLFWLFIGRCNGLKSSDFSKEPPGIATGLAHSGQKALWFYNNMVK